MKATRRFSSRINIDRVISSLEAAGSCRRPRPIIAVIEPTARWIKQIWRLINGEKTLPFRFQIAAVHWFGPIKPGIATRDEVAVKVGNVPIRIRVDGVVR